MFRSQNRQVLWGGLYCLVFFLGANVPSLAQSAEFPVIVQSSGPAGVLLPGKTWQNIQKGQTLPAGSEVLTSLSGLQLSFSQAHIALSPFCYLTIKRTGADNEKLLFIVQTGQVHVVGDTKLVQVKILEGPQLNQSETASGQHSSPDQTFAQTYRILSPGMGL